VAAAPTVISILALIFAVLFVFAVILIWIVFVRIGDLWLQALMSGTPVTALEILGMRLRRIDARGVVRVLIMARQGGVAVTCRQMESTCLQGVDLEKLTLAMIHAKKQGMEMTFEELVAADLEDRLAEKSGRQVGSVSGMQTPRSNASTAFEAGGHAVRTCRKCSKQVADDSKICRNCGAIL
jgi:uncharacterized protein YqfA (UPF0365 family)